MNKPVKVLIVEDSEDDAKLALRALRGGGFEPTHRRVQTATDLKNALAEECWDAVISDYQMPGFTGMDALGICRSSGLDLPFILTSGTIGEETAVHAMKAGASDYIMKNSLTRLAPALDRELKETQIRAAHRQVQGALAVSETRFRQMAENISDVFFLQDADSHQVLYVSPAYETIWGRSCASLLADPESWAATIAPDDRAATDAIYRQGMATGKFDFECRIVRPDGSLRSIETRVFPVLDGAGKLVRIAGVAKDITERRAAEGRIAYLNRVHAVLSGINALIVRVRDRDELFREACRIAVDAGGFQMAWIGIVDRSAMQIVPAAAAGLDAALLSAITARLSLQEDPLSGNSMSAQAIRDKTAIVSNDSKNDPRLLFLRQHDEAGIRSLAVLPLLVADQAVGIFVLNARERGFFQEEELKRLTDLAGNIAFAIDHLGKQDRLDYLAYYDELTGLANRRLFLDRVAQYMRCAISGGYPMGVFLIDLDRFKNINDSLGRPAGDALLRQVAEWLTRTAGDANFVARVGADVFALVMPEVKPDGDLARLIERTLDAFRDHPFRFDDTGFKMDLKLGAALFPDDGAAADADTLFRRAEAALKNAKASGARFLSYTPEMSASVTGGLSLENALRRALDNSEFILHYQPKVSCATGKITGFEALLRWRHPQRGLVAPLEFVPMLEETGLIVPVGAWVLATACTQARIWHDAGLGVPSIAVNVSGRQIDLSDLSQTVQSVLAASGLAPGFLELEFTEGHLMKDAEGVIDLLRRLKALGVRLSVDDFGTGYSSLAYLKRFPIDSLKVDRAFVRDITADPNDVSITRAIITLAHSLKLKVVAEGVETEGQLGLLIANHCDEIQGYYFSRPLPTDEATALLREGRSLASRMMSGMKRTRTLLLVDDEPNILSALTRLLRKDGYLILTAPGGKQGLELLASHPVDVIISDQRMPGMSGVEFLRRVKVLHPDTLRLVLSGYTDLQSVTDAINEGAIYKFLTKPWDAETLQATIQEAFRSKETADDNRRHSEAAVNETQRNLPAERGAAIDA